MYMIRVLISAVFFLGLLGCSHDEPALVQVDVTRDVAQEVETIYTDSGVVQFRIIAAEEATYFDQTKLVREYPKGVHIAFYTDGTKVRSSIRAKYALHIMEDGVMHLRDSVVLTNEAGDKLMTTGILWNDVNKILSTKKYVQLIDAESKDTFFGYGFESVNDFSRFTITQFSGKRKFSRLSEEFGLD